MLGHWSRAGESGICKASISGIVFSSSVLMYDEHENGLCECGRDLLNGWLTERVGCLGERHVNVARQYTPPLYGSYSCMLRNKLDSLWCFELLHMDKSRIRLPAAVWKIEQYYPTGSPFLASVWLGIECTSAKNKLRIACRKKMRTVNKEHSKTSLYRYSSRIWIALLAIEACI
jgi:hypothetical protein